VAHLREVPAQLAQPSESGDARAVAAAPPACDACSSEGVPTQCSKATTDAAATSAATSTPAAQRRAVRIIAARSAVDRQTGRKTRRSRCRNPDPGTGWEPASCWPPRHPLAQAARNLRHAMGASARRAPVRQAPSWALR
jgi:hypothetical protein